MCKKRDLMTVEKWTTNEVHQWLKSIKFEKYFERFKLNSINGQALLMINEDDIRDIVENIGDRKNLYFHIINLQIGHSDREDRLAIKNIDLKQPRKSRKQKRLVDAHSDYGSTSSVDSVAHHNHVTSSSSSSPRQICENCLKTCENVNFDQLHRSENKMKSDKLKTFVSFIYCFITCLWTSFVLTVVHDRVPNMQKYPPLPDIILDNVPLIPGAFYLAEGIGVFLCVILLLVLIFHRYRWIIIRRLFSLGGSIFLLRSVTMLITSLSVPGVHIQCSSQKYGSLINQIKGALEILSGAGLAIQGVRTCGDYMFSGHSVCLTLLTHFICEYTPYTFNWLHTIAWTTNFFGLFFILAAHEHYSIDVFIAFYITSRMFVSYHSLANNKALFQHDKRRVKIWFPLFSYFEENIRAQVPNEYEKPSSPFKYIYVRIKRIFSKLNRSHAS